MAHYEVDQRDEDQAADADDARPALPQLPALQTATARSCERAVPLLVVEIAPAAERAHVAFAFVARNPFGGREAALVIEADVHLRVFVDSGVVLDGVPRVARECERSSAARRSGRWALAAGAGPVRAAVALRGGARHLEGARDDVRAIRTARARRARFVAR